jgi:CelD/BcsL family acetyltransferase involved in cellulose biosynthesis
MSFAGSDSGRSQAIAASSPPSSALPTRAVVSKVVSDRHAFESMAREWDELVDSSSQKSYFMRWQWNFLWWTHLAPRDAELRIVECRTADGLLVGLCPLYLRRDRAFKVVPIRELVFLGTGVKLKTSEYLDIATRCGYEDIAPRSMAAVLTERDDWDRLCCSRVPDDSPVMRQFVAAMDAAATCQSFERASYVDTSNGWVAYKNTLGRSMRRNVEYYARRLFKKYRCEFQRVDSQDELQTALAAMVDLHIGQWLSKGEIGSLSSPVFQRFLQDAARSSFADSRLRVWTLRIEGRIEGVLLGFLDDGILHYFQKGHNPAFSKDDLGTALVSLCIRDCCDDPHIRAFDFMGGGAAYKEMWARQVRLTIEGVVSRKNIRARAFEFQYRLGTAATAVYRAVIPLKLRAARRDWLNARNFRDQLRRLGHNAAGAFVPMSALPDGLDWTITSIETAILLIVGLS